MHQGASPRVKELYVWGDSLHSFTVPKAFNFSPFSNLHKQ
jgi:hypothetical protein